MLAPRYRFENAELFGAGTGSAQILGGAAKQLVLHRQRTGRAGRTLVSICAAGGLGVTAILESA
jgi:acetyl-CoA C-acetyltransferase